MRKVTIITGHYGSGKSNISTNLAMEAAAEGKKVTVVDLDIVNPYFRTADFAKMFEENGIELITPSYANTNLDIPALNFDIERIAKSDGYLIIDVGGDDDGAIALGRFSAALNEFGDNLDMFYVINRYRYLTKEPSEAVELMYNIETASKIKHTGIINNSNLGCDTLADTVISSLPYADMVSQSVNLPIVFSTIPRRLGVDDNRFKPIEIYVKPFWER
ncbi:MAG: P-loop NTPase [Oscillospiraceae bacterium]|nr:P-loop NTPase [Oscillospiraceae bacterium]